MVDSKGVDHMIHKNLGHKRALSFPQEGKMELKPGSRQVYSLLFRLAPKGYLTRHNLTDREWHGTSVYNVLIRGDACFLPCQVSSLVYQMYFMCSTSQMDSEYQF